MAKHASTTGQAQARGPIERRTAVGIALACALALFLAGIAILCALLPAQSDGGEGDKDYGYVYSGVKSASVDFTCSTMVDDAILLFGSSELSTPPSLISEVPAVVFGQQACGLDLVYIGEAYDQSLWQAIAAGAYAPRLENKKVALIVSPSWFFDGGLDNSLFKTRFSYSLYRQFMGNPYLSDVTKDYVRTRLAEQGVDSSVVAAGAREGALGACNDFFYSFMDDL